MGPVAAAAPSAGPWLQRDRGRHWSLSEPATDELRAVLACLRLEPGHARFVFGFTAHASAFVVGRRVTVHRRRFQTLEPRRQLGLLAHELTHVAQYAALRPFGVARFLVRYLPDYHLDPRNYALPRELAVRPLHDVDLLDPRFTLDQIAERFRHEVDPIPAAPLG